MLSTFCMLYVPIYSQQVMFPVVYYCEERGISNFLFVWLILGLVVICLKVMRLKNDSCLFSLWGTINWLEKKAPNLIKLQKSQINIQQICNKLQCHWTINAFNKERLCNFHLQDGLSTINTMTTLNFTSLSLCFTSTLK